MNSLNRPTQQKLVWRSLTLPSSLVIWFSIGRLKNGANVGGPKHVCPHLSDLGLCTFEQVFSKTCAQRNCVQQQLRQYNAILTVYTITKYVPHSENTHDSLQLAMFA